MLCNALANVSVKIRLSKAQLSKIVQAGACLGRLLGTSLKTGLLLLIPKSMLILLGLTAVTSVAGAHIHKKPYKPFLFSFMHYFEHSLLYRLILLIIHHTHCDYNILNSISKFSYCLKFCKIIYNFVSFKGVFPLSILVVAFFNIFYFNHNLRNSIFV